MEGDQLIAQTRHLHLHLAGANNTSSSSTSSSGIRTTSTSTNSQISDPDAGACRALSVPASPRSMGHGATSPTGCVPSSRTGTDNDATQAHAHAGPGPGSGPGPAHGDAVAGDRCRGHGGDGPDMVGGEATGVRLGRSTAAAAARPPPPPPVHGLASGLVDKDDDRVRGMGARMGDATGSPSSSAAAAVVVAVDNDLLSPIRRPEAALEGLPVEVVFHIMSFLDVNDLLSVSRTCHQLRSVSLTPLLHAHRLQRTRLLLPPMLSSPSRPSLADLIARSIFLTHTTVVSRRLARSLVSIRLSRRLAARPSPESLAERAVLPRECLPPRPDHSIHHHRHHHHHHHERDLCDDIDRHGGRTGRRTPMVSPALVQQRRRVERERIKDGLRRWVGAQWLRAVKEKGESVRLREERIGVGRVWRLTRFWERVSRGEAVMGH